MKKMTFWVSALAAALIAGSMSLTAFAASNPADDAGSYSFNTGRQAYTSRMAEDHVWYNNEDDSVTADYSFNAGDQAAQSRNNIFANIPSGDNVSKEDIEAWFESNGIGKGSAWSDGQYNESAKSSYGYLKGQTANQQRQASFSEND